jgi:hypothetical protein
VVLVAVVLGVTDTSPDLQSLPDHIAAATNPACEVCFGGGLVCERHPLRTWERGAPSDCRCGAPGMPCRCTGLL